MQLETERLLIRPFAPGDEADAIKCFTDPEFMAFSPTGPLKPEGARARLQDQIDLYREHGFSKLALVEKASGRLIGYCGFGYEEIDGKYTPELGFRLLTPWRGKGFITEAGQAIIEDAFTRLGMTHVIAVVYEKNMPSRRALERLGLVLQRRLEYRGREVLYYRLERPA